MTAIDTEAVRAQSAALAAALGQDTGPGRPLTANGHRLLTALARDPSRTWRPIDLIGKYPGEFGNRDNPESCIHRTAVTLANRGLVRRRKRLDRRGYQVTEAGLAALS